ncbi:MAG: MATE family efflux transporter [Clostridia bacterium]|nr:MATE family efflux transporter [Clostridia bacterium]
MTKEQMTQGPLLKKLFIYTIPIMATGLLQLLFNAADLIVIGRWATDGDKCLAAVGSTGSLINLIVNLFIGLSVGTSVTVAQRCGADDKEGLRRIVHTSMAAAIVGGIIVFFIGFFGSRTFLGWMGTLDDVMDLATKYMKIYFVGIPASMIYNFGGAILRSSGDTKRPLIILSSAGALNVVLNIIFVCVFHMDVDGVAWATTISQTMSAVWVVIHLMRHKGDIHLSLRHIRFHKEEFLQLLKIGIPAGLQGSMFSISNVLIQKSINSFNSTEFTSGNSAAGNIEGFIYVAMNSFHQTALTFTGQNVGAKKPERINRVFSLCTIYVVSAGIIIAAIVYLLRYPLLGLYLPDSPASVEAGIQRFNVIATTYFLCGAMEVVNGVLRGMGSSLFPMLITVLTVCGFRILWIFTAFAAHGTPFVLFLSYPLSWLLCIAAQFILYIFVRRKLERQIRMSV